MTHTQLMEAPKFRETDLPPGMDKLLQDYPRASWDAHKGFAQATRNWLGAHKAFRKLSRFTREDTQRYLDKTVEAEKFASNLSYFGNALVANLYGHHHWEDMEYFPELSAADPRFDSGLAILEEDHQCLNGLLENLTLKANRVIKLVQLDESAAYEEAGELLPVTEAVETLLTRHLADEEDLAVPIILHHRLRG